MKTNPIFALIDCNNFFVSCERVFRPDLMDKPVAVLSNNDGCVIARSNDVKALGVPMGAPYFKYEQILKGNNVTVFSANFHLYGDMSQRVTQVLQTFAPDIEIYSVDESFLEISTLKIDNYAHWAQEVSAQVKRLTGIPVSVGVGPTKTLAKLATEYGKKRRKGGFSLVDAPDSQEILQEIELEDIWGVGRRLGPKLRRYGLKTACDLSRVSDRWAKQHMSVRGLRTVKELRGEACFGLDQGEGPQKSIAATRSFGHNVRAMHELEAAVASFAARAAGKLRANRELAWEVSVYIRTGVHARKQHGVSTLVKLPVPTADTARLIHYALQGLYQIYDPEYAYRKAGVILTRLITRESQQMSLLDGISVDDFSKRDIVMNTVDTLNHRFGKETLRHAIQGAKPKQRWHSKRELMTPAYTTDWNQLPRVKV